MRAKRENSSTIACRRVTEVTIVSAPSSRVSPRSGLPWRCLATIRSAARRIGVSGFLISCATRRAASLHAASLRARSSSVRSSSTSTRPVTSPAASRSSLAFASKVRHSPSSTSRSSVAPSTPAGAWAARVASSSAPIGPRLEPPVDESPAAGGASRAPRGCRWDHSVAGDRNHPGGHARGPPPPARLGEMAVRLPVRGGVSTARGCASAACHPVERIDQHRHPSLPGTPTSCS